MIPVIWHEGPESRNATEGTHGRTRYAATCMLNDMLDTYNCQHWIRFSDGMPKVDGAVVVIHGGNEHHLVNQINEDLARFKWVVVIAMGDEESEFPYHQLRHPNMKLWIQSPIPNQHRADRFHLFGYMWDCHKYKVSVPKDIDWFFAGQITHDRRHEMQKATQGIPNGTFIGTQGFAQGLDSKGYFELMSRSKIVLCPTGPVCPDSFRFAETLEVGGIPIVDWHPSGKPSYPYGFWEMLFPNGFPFPIMIEGWSNLPKVVDLVLTHFDSLQKQVLSWWTQYKTDYYNWLSQDLHALGAGSVL